LAIEEIREEKEKGREMGKDKRRETERLGK
jgi:hypothetical protein